MNEESSLHPAINTAIALPFPLYIAVSLAPFLPLFPISLPAVKYLITFPHNHCQRIHPALNFVFSSPQLYSVFCRSVPRDPPKIPWKTWQQRPKQWRLSPWR